MNQPHSDAGYTLTLKPGAHGSDASVLLPEKIGSLPIDEVRALLGDCFNVEGTPGDTLTIHGLPALDGIGARMTRGTLIVHGQVGDDLGASMSGGVIHVLGRAGNRVGGPASSSNPKRQGMTGGCIVIHGDAGDYAGLRMRRGIIAITGQAGVSPGYRMIAGTLAIGSGDLNHPGLEMQRGTIISLQRDARINTAVTFASDGVFNAPAMAIIGLMLSHLHKLGMAITSEMKQGRWRFSSGDRLELGKGEIWQWTH